MGRIKSEVPTAGTKIVTGITVGGRNLMDVLREGQKKADKLAPARKKEKERKNRNRKRKKSENSGQNKGEIMIRRLAAERINA